MAVEAAAHVCDKQTASAERAKPSVNEGGEVAAGKKRCKVMAVEVVCPKPRGGGKGGG